MRRIVTGYDFDGKAVIVSEGKPFVSEPIVGWKLIELWSTEGKVIMPDESCDSVQKIASFTPEEGGTRFRIFTISLGIKGADSVIRQQLQETIVRIAP